VPDITPGTEKRIVWADAPGAAMDWAVIYVHGFSATSEEIRPVPDLVAKALGANLFYTRLAGHGVPGDRLADAKAGDWMTDVAEALAIGRKIGRRTLVIATSTGGTVAAEAALDPVLVGQMDAVVFVSPNFGLNSAAAAILTMPLARYWGPVVAGPQRCFESANDLHARFWTTCYPTTALFQMAAVAKHAANANYSGAKLPALFVFSDADQVVSPSATRKVAAGWGKGAEIAPQTVGPGDDAYSHVIAGDILSPSMSAPVAARITAWARAR
jgi:alpha-beta hydrolase superfamily lysophospholipase